MADDKLHNCVQDDKPPEATNKPAVDKQNVEKQKSKPYQKSALTIPMR
jgi:hypothetical protein